jgi:hypothetical protein
MVSAAAKRVKADLVHACVGNTAPSIALTLLTKPIHTLDIFPHVKIRGKRKVMVCAG